MDFDRAVVMGPGRLDRLVTRWGKSMGHSKHWLRGKPGTEALPCFSRKATLPPQLLAGQQHSEDICPDRWFEVGIDVEHFSVNFQNRIARNLAPSNLEIEMMTLF